MTTVILTITLGMDISTALAIIPIIAGAIVYLFERKRTLNSRYNKCSSDLYQDNETARITSAILLRDFLKRPSFKENALNLISALLKGLPNGNLQKTLGDGLSFVNNADGQDFQGANLSKVSIKSPKRIRYEITGNRLLNKKNSFRKADFYKADISECSISNVNFDKAIFMDAILSDTSFHNCSFKNANFKYADLSGTLFFNCNLDGANFSTARHRKDAQVIQKEKDVALDTDYKKLPHYLDKKGRFESTFNDVVVFPDDDITPRVFLSHLGMMDSQQQLAYRNLKSWLEEEYQITFDTIERKDYRTSGQLRMVKDRLSRCSGVVIMAFSHLTVKNGTIHDSTDDTIKTIEDVSFPSPWLQIETAFARSAGLPCLVIVQKGLNCNGIFDQMLVQNEKGLYMVNYDDSVNSLDKKVIRKWANRFKKAVQNSGNITMP